MPMDQTINQALRQHWLAYAITGAVQVLFGGAWLWYILPIKATSTEGIFVGWLVLGSGVLGLVAAFWLRSAPGFWWSLLSAALGSAIGAIVIYSSGNIWLSEPFLLSLIAFFTNEAMTSILFALKYRRALSRRWVWLLAYGILVLGWLGMSFTELSGSVTQDSLSILIGICKVFSGTVLVILALRAHDRVAA
jgi:uncharacterized membrane protein HdeD (DUF308 family)